jgi:DtxR family Mn-dependent transcriptional regulator
MPSLTVENYVKTIYTIAAGGGGHAATTGEIAAAMAVSPGTVTAMLKTLDAAGLASYTPYEGVALTRTGRVLALRVLRRHRLIELFLMRTLGLTWDEVHDEAEHMEHAVSDTLVERIDAYLGRPDVDPHGDPIPAADAHSLDDAARQPSTILSACAEGGTWKLSRVLDQSAEFLRFLTDSGLSLGATVVVEQNPDGAGLMRIRADGRSFPISLEAAAKLQVSGR